MGLAFRGEGLGLRVQGFGIGVWGSGCTFPVPIPFSITGVISLNPYISVFSSLNLG